MEAAKALAAIAEELAYLKDEAMRLDLGFLAYLIAMAQTEAAEKAREAA